MACEGVCAAQSALCGPLQGRAPPTVPEETAHPAPPPSHHANWALSLGGLTTIFFR